MRAHHTDPPHIRNFHVALRARLSAVRMFEKSAQRAAAASSDHILKKSTVVVSVWCRCGVGVVCSPSRSEMVPRIRRHLGRTSGAYSL